MKKLGFASVEKLTIIFLICPGSSRFARRTATANLRVLYRMAAILVRQMAENMVGAARLAL
jgi:hypothetical protein